MIDIIIHLDKYLAALIQTYGTLTYAILFFIIFAETGFVFTPFLPGDSLLFATGSLSSLGALNHIWLFIILAAAAILGDTVNYWVGFLVGEKIKNSRFIKKEYLTRTHEFYERHGGKTIIIARFIPIIRTFAPFVAGIGKMNYFRFLTYNIMGGILWVAIFVFGGFYFGNLPIVRENFSLIILAIILISVMPILIEVVKNRK